MNDTPNAPDYHTTPDLKGIFSCFRVERNSGAYRCCQCGEMQHAGSNVIYVPDHVKIGDPGWSVEEAVRQSRYNGYFSGWCVPCVRKLCRPKRGTPRHTDAPADDLPRVTAAVQILVPFIFGVIAAVCAWALIR